MYCQHSAKLGVEAHLKFRFDAPRVLMGIPEVSPVLIQQLLSLKLIEDSQFFLNY